MTEWYNDIIIKTAYTKKDIDEEGYFIVRMFYSVIAKHTMKDMTMHKYEFELLFRINTDEDVNDLVEKLYEAGCDDALIGSGRKGMIGLSFTREAASEILAFECAIKDVKKAIPSASLVEAKPEQFNNICKLSHASQIF